MQEIETFDSYSNKVLAGQWPSNPKVPLPDSFTDDRGIIQNLMLKSVDSVVVITSRAGTVRANHWHRTDWHYCYVISGQVIYCEKPYDKIDEYCFKAGEMFFSPPDIVHAMVFPVDTTFIVMARNVRTHDNHEHDLVRQILVDDKFKELLIARYR